MRKSRFLTIFTRFFIAAPGRFKQFTHSSKVFARRVNRSRTLYPNIWPIRVNFDLLFQQIFKQGKFFLQRIFFSTTQTSIWETESMFFYLISYSSVSIVRIFCAGYIFWSYFFFVIDFNFVRWDFLRRIRGDFSSNVYSFYSQIESPLWARAGRIIFTTSFRTNSIETVDLNFELISFEGRKGVEGESLVGNWMKRRDV